MATTVNVGTPIGTIKLIIGDVKIRGADGVERIAVVGEKVFAKEILITAANAVVQIQLENGNLLDLGRNAQLVLDEDMLAGGAGGAGGATPPGAATAAAATQDVAAIQAAIAAGVDPTKIAEATAAGGAPGAGGAGDGGGSHEPLVINQANPTQAVNAGFGTVGEPPPIFTLPSVQLPPPQTPLVNTAVTLSTTNVTENAPGVTFTATLTTPGTSDVTITTNLGNIVVPAGQTAGTLFVATADPDVFIDPSSLTATVTGVSGGDFDGVNFSTAAATAQIADTIDPTTVSLSTGNVTENDPSVTFTATLSNPGETAVTVATNLGNIVIAAGQTTGTLVVNTANPDAYVDPSSITATVTGVTGGNFEAVSFAGATATAQITDTVDTTTVSLSTANVTENDPSVTFTATLSNVAQTAVTVATNLGNIVIAAGQTSGTLVVSTADPDVYIDPSSITATVNGVTGGNFEAVVFAGATATAQITDTIDTTTVALSTSNVTENDPSVTFTATLSNPGETAVTVATNLGNIVIAAGQTSGTLVVSTVDPDVYIDPSSITATVSGVTGGNFEAVSFAGASATAQISDVTDTVTATLTASPSQIPETGGSVTYTITLTGGPGAIDPDTNLVFNLANGEQVTIAAGATAGSVTRTYSDAEITTQQEITNSITGIASGGSEYENLVTAGTVATDVDFRVEITNLTPAAQGGDVTVDEDDLLASRGPGESAGSDPTKESTTQTGTFNIRTEDGLDDLTIGGNAVITNGVFTPTTFTTPFGNILSVTSFNAATGEVTYTYTLNDNETQPTGAGENSLFENFTVVLTDLNAQSDTDTLSVNIVDDVPDAIADNNGTASENNLQLTGNVLANDVQGADSASVTPVSITGTYGSITINAAGNYTYTLSASDPDFKALVGGATASEVFTYTLTDADGDVDTATLTLGIRNDDDGVTITNLTPQAQGGDVTVDEDDLLASRGAGESVGSDTTKESTTQAGSFNISTPDGVDDLTIGGNAVITDGVFTATTFTTPLGNTLAVTAYNATTGQISYTYTLNDNETQATGAGENSLFENLAVVLTDRDGDTANNILSVNIVDDVPDAIADSNAGPASESNLQLTGNVLANDVQGADGASVTPVTLTGTYGSVTIAANGNYTYTLNPSDPDFKALVGGATASEVFSYTLTDADGDADTATLTLGIRNNDDGVLITNLTPLASGGDVTVDEDDLLAARGPGESAGSDTTKESTTQGGTFTISAPDGVNNLTIGGNAVITNGVFTATSFTTGLGNALSVTAYNATTGDVSYTYTLNDNETHATAGGENSLFENLAVVLTDRDGDTANDILSVNIIDDVPTLTVNDIDVNRTAGLTNGTGTFIAGADGGAVNPSTLQWANPISGFTFTQTSANTWSATETSDPTQVFFNITINPDGTYAFDLVTPIPTFTVPSGPLFSGITGGSSLPEFTFGAEKFNNAFALQLTGSDNSGPGTITISSTELGINGNSIQEQSGETLKIDVLQQPGFETATITSLAIGIASTGSVKTGDVFRTTVFYQDDGDPTTVDFKQTDVNYNGSGVLDFDLDPAPANGTDRIVDYVTFTPIANNVTFKVTGISLEFEQPIDPSDQHLNFSVSGVDGDGDQATDTFSVTLIAGTAGNDALVTGNTNDEVSGGLGNDTINAGAGNDILIGGQGNDILTGSTGNDVFKFESITEGTDSITDFTIGNPAGNANADVLNLQDVLGGNATVVAAVNADNAATVGQYIHFSVSGTTATLLVDTAGTSAGVPLATFSVPAGTTDSGLLNQLLANNQIVV